MDQDDKNLLELAHDIGGVIQATQDNQARIHRLVGKGLLKHVGNRYRLTEAGVSAISN
jgi:hypothetical protein